MNNQLLTRLERTNRLYLDLLDALAPGQLEAKLGSLRSNTIAEQLWCVTGARRSYARAAAAGSWQGFTPALNADELSDTRAVKRALGETLGEVTQLLSEPEDLAPAQQDFLLDLLEHEAQHHGQLIRYIYALGITPPDSWKQRYALD